MDTSTTNISLADSDSQVQPDQLNISAPQVNDESENTGANRDESANAGKTVKIQRRRRWVIFGFLLVLAGWVFMMFYPWLSLGCTVVGLIFSIMGVRIPPGPRRDIGTTAIVAASVLLLVFALFAIVLYLI